MKTRGRKWSGGELAIESSLTHWPKNRRIAKRICWREGSGIYRKRMVAR